ncbi:hypothetical protein T492DRAFT_838947 [Pavlovales sp. CCMP2436]|nr:hypothetical protein T492DRAFT_838947 [Pavlovales sp. CCMP2436]
MLWINASLACTCISWCTTADIAGFLHDLPVVSSRSSPWYPYIKDVYQGDVPLPIDMRVFGFFALFKLGGMSPHALAHESARRWLAPLHQCGAWKTHAQLSQTCPRERCISKGWIRDEPPLPDRGEPVPCEHPYVDKNCIIVPWSWSRKQQRLAGVWRALRQNLFKGSLQWSTLPHTRGARVAFHYWAPVAERQSVPNNTWIEVHRWVFTASERTFTEGVGYGCWAWPLLPPHPRGSGVLVNVGRTLFFRSRREALKWCPESLPSPPNPPGSDNLWARKAREEGYDSIQLLRGYMGQAELLITRQECISQTQPTGACFPSGVEMRTGANAELPCTCMEYDRHGKPTTNPAERILGVINCDGTRLAAMAAAQLVTAKAAAEPISDPRQGKSAMQPLLGIASL